MAQLFSNNAESTLAANISDSATSITVQTGDGTQFQSPTGGDYELITLSDTAGNIEIVKCTARSTDALTITRAQESTAARAWNATTTYVKGCITAATVGTFPQGFDNGGNAKGTNAVNLQPSRSSATQVASGTSAITLGKNTTASATESIAIGADATCRIANAWVTSGAPMIRKHESLGSSHKFGSGASAVIVSDVFSLLSTGTDVVTISIPTGAHFYVDEVYIIITSLVGSISVHPVLTAGYTGSSAAIAASTTLASEANYSRHKLTAATAPGCFQGVTSLTVSVTTAATVATTVNARVMFKGVMVEDT